MNGADSRKSRRINLKSSLVMKRIDNGIEEDITIDIHDLSKTGIGFTCEKDLEMDAVYESYITIWTKEVIHTLLKIVRKTDAGEGCLYGAIFMGLSEIDAYRIEVFDAVDQERAKMTSFEQTAEEE